MVIQYENLWVDLQATPPVLGGLTPILTKSIVETLGFENVDGEFMIAGRIMSIEIVWGDVY